MSAVKTCPFEPADFQARFRASALAQGFREEPWTTIDGVPLAAFTKRPSAAVRRSVPALPRIYVSTGVHGDEPAPPLALLQLLDEGIFDDSAIWFLVPMVNPTGFRLSTRENHDGIDLNRDYLRPVSPEVQAHVHWLQSQPRFDLALCLHEDWESKGFYLYELNTRDTPGIARALRDAGQTVLPIDPDEMIDGRPIDEPGIIRPEADPALRETWPEAIYLRHHHTPLCYTTETPSSVALDQRIATINAMVRTALRLTTQSGAT
ncbi:M14 family metallopeptidase [Actomonas aquatica]|uniref:M14 family metallocarboxypeptidase n=1 Tax=Actomonas aquatica TaxID=2866162 RepID=A0ABZ1C8L0_9BACT|nr:M14 family metallocarboxypeptidase [Opitutus sp. WL0086]WRQ88033.1 M14 family metallocarboxypeptidase [Opitutus sp. WL0086]